MNEHPNAVAFEAWNSGRLDVIREYFTDDASCTLPGTMP
jgi:hypothetical protein